MSDCNIVYNKTKHNTPFCTVHRVICYDCGCKYFMNFKEMKWCHKHKSLRAKGINSCQ